MSVADTQIQLVTSSASYCRITMRIDTYSAKVCHAASTRAPSSTWALSRTGWGVETIWSAWTRAAWTWPQCPDTPSALRAFPLTEADQWSAAQMGWVLMCWMDLSRLFWRSFVWYAWERCCLLFVKRFKWLSYRFSRFRNVPISTPVSVTRAGVESTARCQLPGPPQSRHAPRPLVPLRPSREPRPQGRNPPSLTLMCVSIPSSAKLQR